MKRRSLSEEEVRTVRAWLKRAGFHRPEEYRPTFLARRILPRFELSGQPDLEAFLRDADRSAEKRAALFGRFLIPTTEWFRNAEVFEALTHRIRSAVEQGRWASPKILCAACSTGEEPLSLSMNLHRIPLPSYDIVCLDRSLSALLRLGSGTYPDKALRKVDNSLRDLYFNRVAGGWLARDEVRNPLHPLCWDLGVGLPPGPFHVILLRNVLIYMTEAARRRLLRDAFRSLREGGLLVLGKSESPGRIDRFGFCVADREQRIYEREGGIE